MGDAQLLDHGVRYLAASLVAADDAQRRLLAGIALNAVVDLAQRRSHTSGDAVPRDAFEAVRAEVLAAVRSQVLAVTPELAAALAGLTEERAIVSAYRNFLTERFALRQ